MSKLSRFASGESAPRVLNRRGFLIGATQAGITLAFAPSLLAEVSPSVAIENGKFEPTLWFDIDRSGIVTVNVTEAEMGQHIGTALARIVADELEADWADVKLNYVDSDPKWGLMVTGGSWSIWHNFVLLSRAGAAGRLALIDAGAKMLGVTADRCVARDSVVSGGGKSIRYADIVSDGQLNRSFSAEELEAIPLKSPEQRRLVGRNIDAIDIPDKVNGHAIYGIDATVEGMVFSRPLIPPTRYGSTIVSIDDSKAKAVPGYLKTIKLDDPSNTAPGWAAVIAETFTSAIQAADLVKVEWNAGPTANVSEADLQVRAQALIDDPSTGSTVVDDPGVDEAFANAATTLERTYQTATVLHFQLEPVNALVFENDGVWEIHTGNQWQSLVIPTLAQALGADEKNVVLRTYLLGGGFGRRLNGDYAIPAALAAQAHGGPVKMVFTREDDSRMDSVRSASTQRVRMGFDSDKQVIAMQHDVAAGWPTKAMVPAFMPDGKNGESYDPFAVHGADHWYSVGAHRLRAINNDLANETFRPGWLRAVGSGFVNWALESFMDEAARAVDQDPVQFRLSLLQAKGKNKGSSPDSVGGASRQANVLQRVAKRADWGKKLPTNSGMGIATTFGQERAMPTWIACAAQVAVDPQTGTVKLEKLTLSVDAGTIIHPDGALAQMEGAALWGASMALHEGTRFENGQVKDTNLDTYTPLRMADLPELDIDLVPSNEMPVGLGEPATTVVGPAIANAIFAATGARVRNIPISAQAVKQAIAEKTSVS